MNRNGPLVFAARSCAWVLDRDDGSSALAMKGQATGWLKGYHRCPFPIGWLINRGVCLPLYQQVSMMIDGIPALGPSIFTKRTSMRVTLW